MKSLTIGIIGAGVSGIAAAKEFIKNGYDITIFEKEDDIGGVWHTKCYPGCLLQTPKQSYTFSDIDYPDNTPLYPTGTQVKQYLNTVCDHFNIRKYIKFNCNVVKTEFISSQSKWNIMYNLHKSNIVNTDSFDYIIVAGGFYTSPNSINNIVPNQYINKTVFSSIDFSNKGKVGYSIFNNKDVVIIGNGATGCDLASQACQNSAKSISVLYRSDKWIYKRYIWGCLSIHHMMNRYILLIIKLLPMKLYIILTSIYYRIVYLWSQGIFMKFPTTNNPPTRKNFVLSDKFVYNVYNNNINYQKTKSLEFKDKIINTDSGPIKYDICVLAIGYDSNISCMNMSNIPYLYKHIIHPDIQQCGFIGYIDALNVAYISELQSKWLIKHIESNSKPDKATMVANINNVLLNKKTTAYDYHDVTFKYAKDYIDLLTLESNLVNKYYAMNPLYWIKTPGPLLWKEPSN